MADETKVAEATEKQAEEKPDVKAESVDDNNVKALQRELQRVRGRLVTAEQTAAQLGSMQATIDALVHTLSGQENLDDASKQTLGAVQQLRQSESQVANQRTAITNQIRDVAQSMGVQSWDDPRVADAVEAFNEGDLVEALSLVKQARRQAKSQKEVDVPKKESDETRIKAEVERQLKELGVREVDKTKTAGATATPATVQDHLAKNIHDMTPSQMAQYKKELLEAYKRG